MGSLNTASGRSSLLGELDHLGHWLAEALNHAFGNPREEAVNLPPAIGVQPYRHRPRRRR
jgi:hypothetical protein